jgi:hypothetical protein
VALTSGFGWPDWLACCGSSGVEQAAQQVPAATITVQLLLTIRRRPGRSTSASTGPALVSTRTDPTLLEALERAHRWQKLVWRRELVTFV